MSSINLQLSPDSISQGEQAIRQEIALQLYDQNIFTFGQARRLANLFVWEFQQLLFGAARLYFSRGSSLLYFG
ncbi:UPF0175 family protein [Nostoc sp. CHAB 5824]|nr:UPF0175 family protein [Nostoc sp. CHAB 5824]